MAYSAMQVANAFIDKKDKIPALTPMKLQKLMFFAQSWYLRMYGCRLINDEFVRWKHGPVIQSIYYEFSKNGGRIIESPAKDSFGTPVQADLSSADEQFLDRVIATYGAFSGWQLSDMSHNPQGAWAMDELGSVISDREMVNGAV
ncbi:Panacea domain-containing protein [Pasteurella multocida]|uniref:Panacea domain-containing protein n=1 Tax=Pasteurella multocida TaxID=747 RepID=UPI00397C3A94